jgi:hypothetical protein
MADNVTFTPGTGSTGATDEIGGVHYPRVKLAIGADGTAVDLGAGAGAVASDTLRATLGSDDPAVVALELIQNAIKGNYETVAASQTAQALGATGATGDFISGILVIPTTVSPGVVTLLDNVTSISVFAGGTSSLSNLVPFMIPLGIKSISGAWKITTGAGVSCIGIGVFT